VSFLRITAFAAIALAASSAFSTSTSGQSAVVSQGRPFSVLDTEFATLREMDALITRSARAGSLRLRSNLRDPAVPNRTVERYQQFYEGIRIWGADVVRDTERGVPISVFGALAPQLSLSIRTSMTADDATQLLKLLLGPDASVLTAPELVVVRLDNGEYRLAYTAVVSSLPDVVRFFVDAHTGEELLRYSEMHRQQAAIGRGNGVLGDLKKLSTEANGGSYIAFDRHRPPTIQTFDMRANLARTKLLFNGVLPYVASDLARDSDNIWTDPSVVDAHVHVSWTYDYYFKRFGRSGMDGRNGPINIVVNAVSQQGALLLPNADADFAINAFWCGSCGPSQQGVMFFGNGIPSAYYDRDGRNYTYFSGALDIAAHELTHAVTRFTSDLIYRNESGALNEAFSDMMGKSVEFFYHPQGPGRGQADYVIGKDIVRGVIAGALNGDRSMANPGLYGDPDHYARRYIGDSDNGGVHSNSGIANQAFYLAIEGGTNRTSGRFVQGVGATNRDQIEKVFYRAFTLLMPQSSTFLVARAATVQAARDLYGPGGAVERAVSQAWDAVGVLDPASASIGSFAGTAPRRSSTTYAITMNANGAYQAVLNWASPQTVDLDLYLTAVGCSFSRASCVLSQSISSDALESVSYNVRSGQIYWLTIDNFSGSSTPFTIQHWISSVNRTTAVPSVLADTAILVGDSTPRLAK
jgi:bacillolysin